MPYSGMWKLVSIQLVNKFSEKHRIFFRLTDEEVKCLPIILSRVRAKQIAEEEPLKHCCEWTVGQPMVESWTRRLREDLDNIGLRCLWADCENGRNKDHMSQCYVRRTETLKQTYQVQTIKCISFTLNVEQDRSINCLL